MRERPPSRLVTRVQREESAYIKCWWPRTWAVSAACTGTPKDASTTLVATYLTIRCYSARNRTRVFAGWPVTARKMLATPRDKSYPL